MTLALGLAFGAFHALEPGHGKTALFVHLLDGRKSRWVPLTMGISTAVSHTISLLIIAFGVHALTHMLADGKADSIVPEVMRWISVALILSVGVWMLISALTRNVQKSTCGCHAHKHETHHTAKQAVHTSPVGGDLKTTALLGTAVGLLPCPSALAAYLTGLTSGNPIDGYLIIAAFGVGIAASIIAVGFVLQCFSTRLAPFFRGSDSTARGWNITRAVVILLIGLSYAGSLSLMAGPTVTH